MADETKPGAKPRPWYTRKTEQGVIITFIGVAMSFIPFTAPVAMYIINAGAAWGGIGIVHRNIKESNEK